MGGPLSAYPAPPDCLAAAGVGPKSAYRSRTSDNARSRYPSGRRLLLGRPRRLETRLAAPPCFKPASKRNTWRRFRLSNAQASAHADGHTERPERPRAGRIPPCSSTHRHRAPPRLLEPRAVSRQLCRGVSSLYCCYIFLSDKSRSGKFAPLQSAT
jgi:hypothetical protein